MALDSDLREELRSFHRRWDRVTDHPETPRSLMSVIEYSLGSQKKAEVYVNRLLRYFLDPDESHGMESEFLRAFLTALPDECDFQEDVHDAPDVTVDEQVQVGERVGEHRNAEIASTGNVDLVLEVPNEWFLLVELKFSAGENGLRGEGPSQTEIYFRSTHVGDRPKEAYESGNYYLYVHPQDEPEANDEHFANWTWEAFTDEVLADVLARNAPRYPQRTVAQLRELIDDVQEITGMTQRQANEREKIELYLDHYDAITDVLDTFDDHWDAFTEEWATRLGNALEADGGVADADGWTFSVENAEDYLDETADADRWTFLDVRRDRPDRTGDSRRWIFRARDSDWGHIFTDGWWRSTDDVGSTIVTRDDGYDDVRVSFIHRLQRNRELAVRDRTLKFYFRNCGSNDPEFRERFNDCFDDRRADVVRSLPESAELTGQKRNLIAATYDIRPDDHEGFFDAYVAALKRAFVDHVVVNDELTRLIDRTYDEAIEMYE